MNVAASTPTIDFVLPDWLRECFLKRSENSLTDQDLICRAFEFGYQLHKGQTRASGEPYIAHPVEVAGILRDLGGSSVMISAGFLHDVVEDTDVTPEEIEARFGSEVRCLVDGVTKLSKFNFSSKTERQAENFRRMFLAMAEDIRVIVVKLADRLHNMRTLEHLSPEKQQRIALETREIFAPLANRLGIGNIKWELEDLAFKYLETESYREVQKLVSEKRADREARLSEIAATFKRRLDQVGVHCIEVSGRPKHLYGIYQKMQRQQKGYEQIYDVAAVRIIVKNNDECYRALAIVHDTFRPIPGRFKDYIGLPKSNRYQSLHTVVIGETGRPLEVQIRTLEMHHVAEYGIAAHWKYKESGSAAQLTSDDEKFTWLRQLLDWQNDLKDAQEYLESIKDNLFDGDVYVFTPKGEVVPLSPRSTPVDFAYRIHTEVGNHCAGAKINGRMVPLDTQLRMGDIVEVITQKNARPSLDWLNFVVTTGARNRIRQAYKRSHRDENLLRGREMLEKELGKNGFESLMKSSPMLSAAERCNYHSVEDFVAAVGYGEITLNLALNRIRDAVKAQQSLSQPAPFLSDSLANDTALLPLLPAAPRAVPSPNTKYPIAGVEGLLHYMAGCCHPLPGEPIIGVITRSNRGISIHRQGCSNVDPVPGDRLVPLSWNAAERVTGRAQTYPIDIQIEVIDRVGVLKDILSRLTDNNINVRNAQVKTFPDQTAVIDLGIDICDHAQLERTFAQIKKMTDVLSMRRMSQIEQN